MAREKQAVVGRYRHYKGKDYRVLGLVKHSETLETLVLYEALYDNPLGRLWVRPASMFLGTVEVDGQIMERFTFIEDDSGT